MWVEYVAGSLLIGRIGPDEEFYSYVELIIHIIKTHDIQICLMSHSNGFTLSPTFNVVHGRDYPIMQQLYNILHDSDVGELCF